MPKPSIGEGMHKVDKMAPARLCKALKPYIHAMTHGRAVGVSRMPSRLRKHHLHGKHQQRGQRFILLIRKLLES